MNRGLRLIGGKCANSLLLLLSLAVSLVVAELVIHYFERRGAPESPKLFYQYDPLLGWSKIPGEEGLFIKPEYEVYEKINSKGLRGPDVPYKKPENEFRTLFLGDSFTEGYAVSDGDHFITKVQDALNLRDDGSCYVAINAGTGAYSTDQELLFWENEGVKYAPDLVVLMFYHNDVWESSVDKHGDILQWGKPRFSVEGDNLALTGVPVPRYSVKRVSRPSIEREALTIKQWLNENSRIYSFVRGRLKRVSWLNAAALAVGLAQEPGRGAVRPGYLPLPKPFWIFQTPLPAEAERAWKLIEALLSRMQMGIRSRDCAFAIFYIPYKAAIYTDEIEAAKRRYDFGDRELDLDRPRDDLRGICERLSIPFIDATERFRERAAVLAKRGERLYYVHDGHWNVEGNELAARILLEYIDSNVLEP
ncbi:MAG: SGNH/GDSL hydrolase family protein [Candidatus Coatesbacteria bacterium]|nr:SGNH/GDSL hydrolase family protein [Candidatus Coatesbacteria bacterium]